MSIYLAYSCCSSDNAAAQLAEAAERWSITSDEQALLQLAWINDRLILQSRFSKQAADLVVDFTTPQIRFRQRNATPKQEAIARAIGITGSSENKPTIIDATAGLGIDAFILAALGCHVTMIERHPVVAALLEDGLRRAYQDRYIGSWLRQRLTLQYGEGELLLNKLPMPDVIYLDPMFPPRIKKAKVKKGMQFLQQLINIDDSAEALFTIALQHAHKRIVVKRPHYAAPLLQRQPHAMISTKNHHFYLYLPTPLPLAEKH